MSDSRPLVETLEKKLENMLTQLNALVAVIENNIISIPTTSGSPSILLLSKENQNLAQLTQEIKNMIKQIENNDDPDLRAQYYRIAEILRVTLTDPSDKNIRAIELASKSTALEACAYKIAKYVAHTKNALVGIFTHYFLEITLGIVATVMLGHVAGPLAFLAVKEGIDFLGLHKLREPYEKKAEKAKKASTQFYQAHEKLNRLVEKVNENKNILRNIPTHHSVEKVTENKDILKNIPKHHPPEVRPKK